MIFLWNPTGDKLDYTYGGLSYTMLPKTRKKVKEPEGNHALNAIGSRGLTKLVFNDEGKSINEEQIEADAIERNREFKVRQIVHYNERNERRKASGQPYDPPTAEVKKYAAELGIALLQGYDMATAEKAMIADLNKKVEEKDKQIKEQGEAILKLTEMVQGLSDQINKGFIKPKDDKDPLVECPVDGCGQKVLASKLKSHMNHYHKDK